MENPRSDSTIQIRLPAREKDKEEIDWKCPRLKESYDKANEKAVRVVGMLLKCTDPVTEARQRLPWKPSPSDQRGNLKSTLEEKMR